MPLETEQEDCTSWYRSWQSKISDQVFCELFHTCTFEFQPKFPEFFWLNGKHYMTHKPFLYDLVFR